MNDLAAAVALALACTGLAVTVYLATRDYQRRPDMPHEVEAIVLMEVLSAAVRHADLEPRTASAIMAAWSDALEGDTVRCSCGRTVLLANDDTAWTADAKHTVTACT